MSNGSVFFDGGAEGAPKVYRTFVETGHIMSMRSECFNDEGMCHLLMSIYRINDRYYEVDNLRVGREVDVKRDELIPVSTARYKNHKTVIDVHVEVPNE